MPTPLRALPIALALALLAGAPAAAAPKPPSAATCRAVAAHRSLPAIRALDPKKGAPRVFAMQFKQDARHVRSYRTFRTAIECQLRRYVVPNLAKGRPNVVVFNEDIGLMTAGIGSRGAQARAVIGDPGALQGCKGQQLCATLKTLDRLSASYARPLAYYERRFGKLNPLSAPFVAATDTIVRGFMGTFSDLARQYGVYMIGSSDQPRFKETTDPRAVKALRDPDLRGVHSVFVATSAKVYNTAFVWGPKDVRRSGPRITRNLLGSNDKVPLTPIEQAQGFSPGPVGGEAARRNLKPIAIPGTKAKLGIATSLPAFQFGDLPTGTDPCADTAHYYMRCLEKLGANVVIQDEANPGPWASLQDAGVWQPLDWMGSTWRAVADPGVRFAYNVTPMLVGNLADLTFDGQSAITQRGLIGPGCHYVGDAALDPADPKDLADRIGDQPQFLALAPWVTPDASRDQLRATAAKLAPGSGDALENDYLETALVADLPFPPDPHRAGCATAAPPAMR